MYFANITALIVGSVFSLIMCEFLRILFKLTRFDNAYTLMLPLFLFTLPTVTYIYLFPYNGTLSGALPLDTTLPSVVGIITYCFLFLICRVKAIKYRFFYCLISFFISSFYAVFQMVGNIVHPVIG